MIDFEKIKEVLADATQDQLLLVYRFAENICTRAARAAGEGV